MEIEEFAQGDMTQDGGSNADGVGKLPRRKTMSPQEKKAHSYCRDRRNAYGNNVKAARKCVPLAKARSHRKLRRADKTALRDVEDAVEIVALRLRKPDWKKSPDISLGLHIRHQTWCNAAADARSRGEQIPQRPNWQE